MKIIYQENANECGACVIAMLANELHDLQIDRIDVLNKLNSISNMGMSLEELEQTANKFGIMLESYECEFNELKELNICKWYVALVKRYNGFHYIIFTKKQNEFTIYDSSKGKYKLSSNDFQKEFANLVCTVQSINFEENNIKENEKYKLNYFISWKILTICLIFQLLGIGLSLVNAQVFKIIIGATINFGTIINFMIIIVPFVILKIIQFLVESLINIFQIKEYKLTYQRTWQNILKGLLQKPFEFYKQNIYGTIFELDNHLTTVINFYLEKITSCIASGIMIIITIIILTNIKIIFLALAIIQILINSCITIIQYFAQKNLKIKSIGYTQKHNEFLTELHNIISYESNYLEYQNVSRNINQNINKTANLNQNIFFDSLIFEKTSEFIKFIFSILIIGIGINFIVIDSSMKLNELIYAISIQTLLVNYINAPIQLGFALISFKTSYKKINGYLQFDNISDNEGILISEPINKITFENITITDGYKVILKNWNAELQNLSILIGKNGVGKTTLLKTITGRNKILNSGNVYLNNNNINEINQKWLLNNIIYLDGTKLTNSFINHEILCNFLNKNQLSNNLSKLLSDTQILTTNPMHYSSGQKQIVKLLLLLNQKQKIILLDEVMSAVHYEYKEKIFETIIKSISQNNLVILIDHDQLIINKVQNIIEVK